MKSIQLIKRTLVSAVVLGMGTAYAADTANINVRAEIQSICSLDATDYNFDFGVLDPAATAPLTLSQDAIVQCTAGTAFVLTPPTGPFTLDSGTDSMAYTLTVGGGTAPLSGTAVTAGNPYPIVVTLSHTEFNYASGRTVGVYTDTQVLSVTP
jgi:hypothetical protein